MERANEDEYWKLMMTPSIELNEEDTAVLLAHLRGATQPVTTQQLIDVLRERTEQASPAGTRSEEGDGA